MDIRFTIYVEFGNGPVYFGLYNMVEVVFDTMLKDRFGNDVKPREWFLVPLPVIDQAVQLLIEERLGHCAGNLGRYGCPSGTFY